jgi:hypothetical protein
MTIENKEPEESETNRTTENLESVGQMIIGGIETVGGILTGDPVTRAEGEYNTEAGILHQETNKNLTAIENHQSEESDGTEK